MQHLWTNVAAMNHAMSGLQEKVEFRPYHPGVEDWPWLKLETFMRLEEQAF